MKNDTVGFQTKPTYNQRAAFTVLKMGDKEIGIWERQFFFSPESGHTHQRFLSGTTHGNSKNIPTLKRGVQRF